MSYPMQEAANHDRLLQQHDTRAGVRPVALLPFRTGRIEDGWALTVTGSVPKT